MPSKTLACLRLPGIVRSRFPFAGIGGNWDLLAATVTTRPAIDPWNMKNVMAGWLCLTCSNIEDEQFISSRQFA
jgi:hypothetical protein